MSILYTAGSGNTIAINRQPNSSDITGGGQVATLVTGSAGGTNLTISDADAVGLTSGMLVTHPLSETNRVSNASLAHASQIAFSAADYAGIVIGETVTGGNTDTGTTVASKAVVNSINIVTLSKAETSASPSGTSYNFSGMIVPGATIGSLSSDGTNTTIVLNLAILGTIPQFDQVDFGNGNTINSSLSVVMLESPATSSASEIAVVQNKKALVSGSITLNSLASTAIDITIIPNFLTVS